MVSLLTTSSNFNLALALLLVVVYRIVELVCTAVCILPMVCSFRGTLSVLVGLELEASSMRRLSVDMPFMNSR